MKLAVYLQKLDPVAPYVSLLVSLSGSLAFLALNLPAAYMSGAVVASCSYALLGGKVFIHPRLVQTGFIFLGVAMGSKVTPETLESILIWPLSIASLAIFTAFVSWAGMRILASLGWDKLSALMASLPGALSTIMALSEDFKADKQRIAACQSLRIIVIVVVAPFVVGTYMGGLPPVSGLHVESLFTADILPWLVCVVLSVPIGYVMFRYRVPAAFVLTGLTITAIPEGSGLLKVQAPIIFVNASYVIIGTLIGSRMMGLSAKQLIRVARDSTLQLGFYLIALVAVGYAVHIGLNLNFVEVLIAYAPGGLEAMLALGLSLDLNPAYMTTHHIIRFAGLAFTAPVLLRYLHKKWNKSENHT